MSSASPPGPVESIAGIRWRSLKLTPAPRNTERAWELVYTGPNKYGWGPTYVRLYLIPVYGWIVDHVNGEGEPRYYDGIRVWPERNYGWALLRASRILEDYRSYTIRDVPISMAGPRLVLSAG